jgi:hypothetical protein
LKITRTPDSQATTSVGTITKQESKKSAEEGLHRQRTKAHLAKYKPLEFKYGSLQQFVSSIGDLEDYSPDLFSVDEVHKIAILDLRILNLDRNTANILVQEVFDKKKNKKKKVLIPIDHGLSLPDNLEVCSFDLAWLSWD